MKRKFSFVFPIHAFTFASLNSYLPEQIVSKPQEPYSLESFVYQCLWYQKRLACQLVFHESRKRCFGKFPVKLVLCKILLSIRGHSFIIELFTRWAKINSEESTDTGNKVNVIIQKYDLHGVGEFFCTSSRNFTKKSSILKTIVVKQKFWFWCSFQGLDRQSYKCIELWMHQPSPCSVEM